MKYQQKYINRGAILRECLNLTDEFYNSLHNDLVTDFLINKFSLKTDIYDFF